MQKKLLAAAVLAALSGGAFAQATNVTMYGRINTGLDNWRASGAQMGSPYDYDSRNRVFDSGSRFGVRGTEDLGNGLRAFFQLEAGFNVDSGTANGQSGAANANANGIFGSRDSFVGIGGAWGDVRVGRQSFYWTGGTIDQVGANYLNTGSNILSGTWGGHVTGAVARQGNTISYNSPNINGFTGSLYYSAETQEGVGAKGANNAANGPSPRDRSYGLMLRYTNGPFAVGFDYATRNANANNVDAANNNATNVGALGQPRWTGWKLMGAWTYMPGSQVALGYMSMNNTVQNGAVFGTNGQVAASTVGCGAGTAPATGVFGAAVLAGGNAPTGTTAAAYCAGNNLRQSAWYLGWEHSFGNLMLIAQYGRTGNVSGSSAVGGMGATGMNTYTLAARYNFSRRTGVYASYIALNNSANSYSDIWGGGYSSAANARLTGTNIGADVRILGVGVMHNF
jgi:predicted porin